MVIIYVFLAVAVCAIVGGALSSNDIVLAAGVGMLIGSAAALLDYRLRR